MNKLLKKLAENVGSMSVANYIAQIHIRLEGDCTLYRCIANIKTQADSETKSSKDENIVTRTARTSY